jgi:hypothetical protein
MQSRKCGSEKCFEFKLLNLALELLGTLHGLVHQFFDLSAHAVDVRLDAVG